MKLRRILWSLFFSLLVLSGCDDKKDDFSGLSDMVAERNEVRQGIADKNKNAGQKALETQASGNGAKADKEQKKRSEVYSIVLYERDIEVVDSSSKRALAKGIAYMNKEGQIVKIKIIKE